MIGMGYNPVTPFRRMMDAALIARSLTTDEAPPPEGVNKWEALRELSVARLAFGLSDRDMTVLQALISFFPATELAGADLVVHPSNAAICARLNGMADSTMRRHLARLVDAGIVDRRDSPNGKRYARNARDGRVVFGFDLAPLARQFPAICQQAEAVRAERDRHQRLRETVSLMRRDLAGLAAYGAEVRPDLQLWAGLLDLAALTARLLRRKLSLEDLQDIEAELGAALTAARDVLEPSDSGKMSTSPAQSGQHYQNSNKNLHDLELREETAKAEPDRDDPPPVSEGQLPRMPLPLVVDACPEIALYADGPIRHWHQLVRAAETVRPMMGVSPSAWDDAKRHLGPEEAAVVLAAMLEKFSDIRSAGGYLRALTRKAVDGGFSSGPMVMALLRRDAA